MQGNNLIEFLNAKVELYNQPSFIKDDPISVPHLYSKKQDIEIAGFFAAIFSWGNRTTIINKSKELMQLMENAPYDFCKNHSPKELKRLTSFKHRTFNSTDLLYFIEFFKQYYNKHKSLETAFTKHGATVEEMLTGFHHYFFSLEHVPARTKKHIATPERKSSCKRLNMFLRWMVRKDDKGVDFGIWKNISSSQLICPIDVHVARVARKIGILKRKQTDWQAALELTQYLRTLDKNDPVKYDFALYGLGVMEKFYPQMTQINTDLIPAINDSFEISLPADISFQELKEKLAAHINHLINHDFEKLVSLLYRIDVNENKIRQLLEQQGGEDAAGLIADLIIERQLQKIKSRKETKSNNEIPGDEKW